MNTCKVSENVSRIILESWINIFIITKLKTSLQCKSCHKLTENGLHLCRNGCFQVCNDCQLQNLKCQKCGEHCVILSEMSQHLLKIVKKYESMSTLKMIVQDFLKKVEAMINNIIWYYKENEAIAKYFFPGIVIALLLIYFLSFNTFCKILIVPFTTLLGSYIFFEISFKDFGKYDKNINFFVYLFNLLFVYPFLWLFGIVFGGFIGFTFGSFIITFELIFNPFEASKIFLLSICIIFMLNWLSKQKYVKLIK